MNARSRASLLARGLVLAGLAMLALKPAAWLARGWRDPAPGAAGGWMAAATALLFLWSVTSRERAPAGEERRRAWWILGLTATSRLAGQLLAINVVAALALVVDVYAVALLAGCARRERALSPTWLAALFALSLPIERLAQRGVGYGLQRLAAAGATAFLGLGIDGVRHEGTRLFLAGREVLVDLPCSGARGLVHGLAVFAFLAAVSRPRPWKALLGLGAALAGATTANSLRIAVLAFGEWRRATSGSFDVRAPFWHEVIGLATLALGLAPVVVWSRFCPASPPRPASRLLAPPVASSVSPRLAFVLALLYAGAAALIVALPGRPLDVSRSLPAIALPASLAGAVAAPVTLSAQETAYFTQYGGAAAKAVYGPNALLVVQSTTPLRHLHGPDECLAGAGHKVERLGVVSFPCPTAVYKSVAPDGRAWRVAVSFVAADGEVATSIGETAWLWLQKPGGIWSAVERITPWEAGPEDVVDFERAVAQALDLPLAPAQASFQAPGGQP